MSVLFDAVSNGQGTTSYSYSHTPNGTPTAVLVAVTNDFGSRSLAVSYGGTAMSLLASVGSPDVTECEPALEER